MSHLVSIRFLKEKKEHFEEHLRNYERWSLKWCECADAINSIGETIAFLEEARKKESS